MKIALIAAQSTNNVIGFQGKLPWQSKLSSDMEWFKKLTIGHPIIMGRKTYESIGRPLPKRTNIVLTKQLDFSASGCLVANSLESAIELARKIETARVFVIGGEEVYRQALPLAHEIFLTIVYQEFEGDAYFPSFNLDEWELTLHDSRRPDERNLFSYAFQILERRETKSNMVT